MIEQVMTTGRLLRIAVLDDDGVQSCEQLPIEPNDLSLKPNAWAG